MKRETIVILTLLLTGCAAREIELGSVSIQSPYSIRLFCNAHYDVSTSVQFQILSNGVVVSEGKTRHFVAPEPGQQPPLAFSVSAREDGSFVLSETNSGTIWLTNRIPTNDFDGIDVRTR